MCRGFHPIVKERQPLKIKGFSVHLSFSTSATTTTSSLLLHQKKKPTAFLYDSLTLYFLPRINCGLLEIDGLNLRPDTPGFITLHHPLIVSSNYSASPHHHEYVSRERVKVSEGCRFEIYGSDDVKLLKGIFRKGGGECWKLDCRCELDQLEEEGSGHFLREAEVCVEMEAGRTVAGSSVISEKVETTVPIGRRRRRRRRRKCNFECRLEEIPEVERELDDELEGGSCCCSDCSQMHVDGGGSRNTATDTPLPAAAGGGYCWGVVCEDVMWVGGVAVGIAYLLSKASSTSTTRNSLRRGRATNFLF